MTISFFWADKELGLVDVVSVLEMHQLAKVRSQKKNDIIWEFFPNVGPPPLLGTPYQKKNFSVYFAF